MAIRSHNQSSPYKTSRYKTSSYKSSVHNVDSRFDGMIRKQGRHLDWNLFKPFVIDESLDSPKTRRVFESDNDGNNKENYSKSLLVKKDKLTELPTTEWKLSKSNRIKVFVECALKNWGVRFDSIDEEDRIIVFEIYNFPKYCNYSTLTTHGININEKMKERLRNLEEWFSDIPNNQCFTKPFKVTLLQKYYETVINIYNKHLQ